MRREREMVGVLNADSFTKQLFQMGIQTIFNKDFMMCVLIRSSSSYGLTESHKF